MSEIIDSYECQLIESLRLANVKVKEKVQNKQDIKNLRSVLTQCDKNIKLIQTQLVGQPMQMKSTKQAKLRQYRKQYDQLKKTTFQLQNNWELQSSKRQLMGSRAYSTESMQTYDKSSQATQRLKQSVKLMHENLEISQNVGTELSQHTNKLINSKKKVQQIRHDLNKSERKIKSMMLRIRKNKLVVRGIIGFIFLVAMIVLVSYFK